jgi:hypothetical protein
VSIYVNPFHARAAEYQRDAHQFITTFSPGALDMLPLEAWDRLVLLRSSPGAGKTSLMRLFTAESLDWISHNLKEADPLHSQLVSLNALDRHGLCRLGILIDLDRDYRALLDLPIEREQCRRLFLRLLDVRILLATLRAALSINAVPYPDGLSRIGLVVADHDARAEILLQQLGGPDGPGLADYARITEQEILRMLDALLDTDIQEIPDGHNELYSIEVLTHADVTVDGRKVAAQPLVMFDDGHRLDRSQRDVLLTELARRRPGVARWYSERFEALSNQELLGGVATEGRDVALVSLDSIARQGSSDGRRFARGRYDRVLAEMARRRAASELAAYALEHHDFLELLEDDRGVAFEPVAADAIAALRARVTHLASDDNRYAQWIEDADQLSGFTAATRWRELEIMILRDQERQQDLFEVVLTKDDLDDRSSGPVKEGAAAAVASEFNVPYFAGEQMVLRLGSHNAQQFLAICGDLFAEMLVDVSLGRPPRLSVTRQHRVLRDASERLWESIPRSVPHGRDVQALVHEIVMIAQQENGKPRMPYPPGVTGTALLMGERNALLDPEYRRHIPGAERLFAALGAAVASNILNADLDYSVKNQRFMVLYLNRLLCPRFGLPLGYGGFRERRLSVMLGWMQKLPRSTGVSEGSVELLAL